MAKKNSKTTQRRNFTKKNMWQKSVPFLDKKKEMKKTGDFD